MNESSSIASNRAKELTNNNINSNNQKLTTNIYFKKHSCLSLLRKATKNKCTNYIEVNTPKYLLLIFFEIFYYKSTSIFIWIYRLRHKMWFVVIFFRFFFLPLHCLYEHIKQNMQQTQTWKCQFCATTTITVWRAHTSLILVVKSAYTSFTEFYAIQCLYTEEIQLGTLLFSKQYVLPFFRIIVACLHLLPKS